ncbi:MAG: HD domain-containing protein [Lachnospiraceae bacterium]|nr:HD domain-containing protein [Lachnospiraceae bacterium]
MAYKMDVSLEEILNLYGRNHRNKEGKARINAAYQYAEDKHKGMIRGTGEPYISHPMRAARMTADWGFECDVIIAALLHDVVEDCGVPLSELAVTFGEDVEKIVDAVTELSDQDAEGRPATKRQKDRRNDVWLQKKMNSKALYVKIADRIDNLNTLDGVPEDKRISKAQHTREIIIPMAETAHAWRFVDVLEELCFKAEHVKMYDSLSRRFEKLLQENSRAYERALDTLSAVFDPKVNREVAELSDYHRLLCRFIPEKRSLISIFRQLCPRIENIRDNWLSLFTKDTVALHNLTLLVNDRLLWEDSEIRPYDVFFAYFEKSLSQKGFYLINYCRTTHNDTGYFLLADELDNLYRVFVKTESEYRRYLLGSIIDSEKAFSMPNVNEYEPRESYNEQIKVFKRNGAAMNIDKGATALDFAFAIHTDLGYHFSYALVNESKAKQPLSYRLNEGDTVTIVDDPNVRPALFWFKQAKTSLAVSKLIQYFNKPESLQAALDTAIEERRKNERK